MHGRCAEVSQLGKYRHQTNVYSTIIDKSIKFFYIFNTCNYRNDFSSFLCKNLFLNDIPFQDYLLFKQLLVLIYNS